MTIQPFTASTDQTEFRITTWPPSRLPHPPLLRLRYELSDDGRALLPIERLPDAKLDSTGEIYLRLRVVELDDPQAILDFANEYGILGVRANGFAGMLEPNLSPMSTRRTIAAAETAFADTRKAYPIDFDGIDPWMSARPLAETVSEFRLGAGWLTDLTNLWLCTQGRSDDIVRWHVMDKPVGEDRFFAAKPLETSLSLALHPFHPRIMLRYPKDAKGVPITADRAAAVDFVAAPLFAVCALELFNHIAEGAEYQRCANNMCRRLFVRQEGRARHAQHRTKSVRFCSERCLRAQKQRDYRARNREEKNRG